MKIKGIKGAPVPETESATRGIPSKIRRGHDVTSAEGGGTDEVEKGRIFVG